MDYYARNKISERPHEKPDAAIPTKMKRVLLISLLAGALIPISFICIYEASGFLHITIPDCGACFNRFMLMLWPSSFWMMGTVGFKSGDVAIVLTLSVLSNAVVYLLIGMLLGVGQKHFKFLLVVVFGAVFYYWYCIWFVIK